MNVAVVLSGCGVFDGSEIHEAVLTMLALDRRDVTYTCVAPRKDLRVVDHVAGAETGETRDVFVESARIARGEITDIAEANGAGFDAVVLPGGFGAAKNLCTFAAQGAECEVDPQVERFLRESHAAGKPIGFACIAPAVGAKVFGPDLKPALTIGHDAGTAAGINALGAEHVACDVRDIVIDERHKIVTTPAYMEARRMVEVEEGIDKMVGKVVEMAATAVNA